MLATITDYLFMFFFFSAVGWTVECTYRSLGERRIINSGFLYGPMCPIYGVGCLVIDTLLVPIATPLEKRLIPVLLLGMALSDTVEYVTSFLMEKLFNTRWWDYSNNFLNLHGRICFKHTMYWAIFTFAYVYIIAPLYDFMLTFIPQQVRMIAVFVILAIFAVDLVLTVKAAADINKLMKKLGSLKDTLREKGELFKDSAGEAYETIMSTPDKFNEWKEDIDRRYLDILTHYQSLESKENKRTRRLLTMYTAMRKTAQDSIGEIESKWNDIKDFFTDSDNEMM